VHLVQKPRPGGLVHAGGDGSLPDVSPQRARSQHEPAPSCPPHTVRELMQLLDERLAAVKDYGWLVPDLRRRRGARLPARFRRLLDEMGG
jgi:hypothetical protein